MKKSLYYVLSSIPPLPLGGVHGDGSADALPVSGRLLPHAADRRRDSHLCRARVCHQVPHQGPRAARLA